MSHVDVANVLQETAKRDTSKILLFFIVQVSLSLVEPTKSDDIDVYSSKFFYCKPTSLVVPKRVVFDVSWNRFEIHVRCYEFNHKKEVVEIEILP